MFQELKLRLIHSMSLFIVMCVFLLAHELSHVVIVWDGRSRNKIEVCRLQHWQGFPRWTAMTIHSNDIPSKETDLVPHLWRF